MIISSIEFDFSAVDSNAWTIFIVGYVIVFTALISLSLLFRYLPKIINFKSLRKNNEKIEKKETHTKYSNNNSQNSDNQDVYVAIAMAINLYMDDMHDDDSLILTIDRDRALNSAWSSKINNINTI